MMIKKNGQEPVLMIKEEIDKSTSKDFSSSFFFNFEYFNFVI